MKNITWTAFVIFWTATITLIVVGVLSPQTSTADRNEPRTITMEELARHSTAQSCWKAIRGKVYDLTEYISKHPTPAVVILQWCGKESTEAYATKGYGRPHSAAADAMLDAYYIGELQKKKN